MDYMENLNDEQKLAVISTDGPVLVLSGAGTGKTSVLTARIVHILTNNLANPWQILALTFTNKAANEMRFRVAQYSQIAHLCRDLWMGTFHSMCLRILRANHELVGLRGDFLIYNEDDQKSVLKRVITNLGMDTKEYSPSDWVERISSIKDKGVTDYKKMSLSPIAEKILNAYNAELTHLGAIDFGDIILYVIKLFESHGDILRKYQRQFRYIMVDEFQDTNAAQMMLLKLLTKHEEYPNICCVGDDDQSIYSWRGAEIKNILDFATIYPGTKIIRLETNYRSTGNILGAANSLIRHNNERLGKDLRHAPSVDMGEPVYIRTLRSDREEVRFIVDTILRNKKNTFTDFVILIRSGSLSRKFEDEFLACGIPYRLVGTTKFYDRMEIRDAIAYIRLLVYPFDDVSFERIISKPRRGFGDAAITKLRESGKSLMDALKTVKLSAKQEKAAKEFLDAFDFDWKHVSPKDAAKLLLEKSGYIKMWLEANDVDATERLEHIQELINDKIARYNTLTEFLEAASLAMADDNDSEGDAKNVVNIMTIHAAKGLEFNTVFLPAWEEGIFPNDKTSKEGNIEEERRLAYVAITRARVRVIITNAESRFKFDGYVNNPPSRFIDEIDKQFLDGYIRNNSIVGKMVVHAQMGTGVVIAENGNVLTIAFKTKGIKNVVRDFVKFV